MILTAEYVSTRVERRASGLASGLCTIAIAAMVANNILCLNTAYNHVWRYDAGTKQAMQTMAALERQREPRRSGQQVRLGIDWVFEPSTNFYRVKDRMDFLEPTSREGPEGAYDYYYLMTEDRPLIERYHLEILTVFPDSGALLARPRS
jgi:hypothetical protein